MTQGSLRDGLVFDYVTRRRSAGGVRAECVKRQERTELLKHLHLTNP